MVRDRFSAMHCSVARAAAVIGDPWTLLVLRDVFLGLHRFVDLQEDLGVASNVLSQRLEQLVGHGVLERRTYSEQPTRHSYHLTAAGRDLYGVVLALLAWGDRHLARDGAPLRVVDEHCGHDADPRVTCGHCGAELATATTAVGPGPGGAAAMGTVLIAARLAASPAGLLPLADA